ncbi:MAG: response regulator [Alphaproteobacteria bacterium]|nr:response regulator [Alphaproteobacteria bacterium]
MGKVDYSRLKILVVEDHEPTRIFLKEVLAASGTSHLRMVADVKSALPLLKDKLLDLLICDLNLGEINGQSLIRAVRLNPNFTNRYMPIIVLTGDSKAETVRELINLGINKFVSKPTTAQSLIEAVRTVLERPKAFVTAKDYFGPDRRNRQEPGISGRRSTDREREDDPVPIPKRTDVPWT